MPRVGFEHMTSVFEWTKTVDALDRKASEIGTRPTYEKVMNRKTMLQTVAMTCFCALQQNLRGKLEYYEKSLSVYPVFGPGIKPRAS
jgi:hypothetical protein